MPSPPPPYAPTLLGVINVSVESMVRDSIARSLDDVHARARSLLAQGVTILDVGGRSITPDAPMIDDREECARLEPAVTALCEAGHPVSVDTWSPHTATEALAWGASTLNFTGEELPDPLLAATAAAGARLILTYMPYGDAYRMRGAARVPIRLKDIVDWFRPRIARARDAGIAEVVVDPNLGIVHSDTDDVTKIHQQLHILWNLDRVRELGCPILLYAARKPERLARLMMASAVWHARPDYIRTHEPEILEALARAATEDGG